MYADIHSYLDSVFPDPTNKTRFLTELAGSLRGVERERKVLVFKGSGANGKSVLMRMIASAYPTTHLSVSKVDGSDELARATFAFGFDTCSRLSAESIYNLYYGSHRNPYSQERFRFSGTLIIHANEDIQTDFPRVCTIEFTQTFIEFTRTFGQANINIEDLAVELRDLLRTY